MFVPGKFLSLGQQPIKNNEIDNTWANEDTFRVEA